MLLSLPVAPQTVDFSSALTPKWSWHANLTSA
jgi:hypothetical protein